MDPFAKKLVDAVKTRSDGKIVNVWSLSVAPGVILGHSKGTLWVEDKLSTRVWRSGDVALAKHIAAAEDACAPGPHQPGAHQISLKYKSDGVTVLKASVGAPINIDIGTGGVSIEVDVSLSFGKESDYLFDTAGPVPWYQFAPEYMGDVDRAALKYMKVGELVVTGAAWSPKWLWYISRSKNGGLAFDLKGDAKLADLDVNSLAAAAGLSLRWTKGEILDGRGFNSPPAFACQIKKSHWFRDNDLEPFGTDTDDGDDGAPPLEQASVDELFDGFTPPDDATP